MQVAHQLSNQEGVLQFPDRPPVLPEFDFEVEKLEQISEQINPTRGIARITTRLAVMSDGSQNILRQIKPSAPLYERRFRYATPLATRVNGFNTYMGIKMAQQGMEVDILGAPQVITGHDYLPHEAYSFAKIMEFVDYAEEGTDEPIIGGLSQGAMKAPGEMAYMKSLGYNMPLGIVQDPCIADETGIVETAKRMTLPYIGAELAEVGKAIAERYDEGFHRIGMRAVHLARTISPSRQYLATHARITRELWRGEAGDLAANLPPESVLIMHFFNKSRMNQRDSYEQKMKHLPFVRLIDQEGLHLTMVRKSVTSQYVDQVVMGQELLSDGATQSEIADALSSPIVKPARKLSLAS